MPAYFVMVACYFFLPGIREHEALPPLWKLLTFTQNIALDLRTAGTFSHAWSLCIEEQFYLGLPVVLLMTRRWRHAPFIVPVLIGAGMAVRALVYLGQLPPIASDSFEVQWYEWIYYPSWSRLDGVIVGTSLAAVYELWPRLRDRVLSYGHRTLVLAIVSWGLGRCLLCAPLSLAASTCAFPAVAAVYGVLVVAALSPSCFLSRYPSRVTESIATLSYAVYLSHKACIHVTQRELGRLGVDPRGNLMFLACLSACLVGAVVLHVVVERPCLRWRDRVLLR